MYQQRYDQHSTPQNTPEIYAGSPQGEQPVPSSDWSTGCVSSVHWEESYPRKSVFRFAQDRRTSVYKGSVLTCFFQDPCLSVGTQFPADLPLFLPTVCVCVCLKAGPGNAQNTSVIARRGLSECGTGAALLEPLLRLSGQASFTGL